MDSLARIEEVIGDPELAEAKYNEAAALRREIGYRSGVTETLTALGRLQAGQGNESSAAASLDEALALATELKTSSSLVLAAAYRALLPGGDLGVALEALREYEAGAMHTEQIEARFVLWKATQDAEHLKVAHRLLQELREHAPEEYRDSMVQNVPLHRDIMAAWEEHGS